LCLGSKWRADGRRKRGNGKKVSHEACSSRLVVRTGCRRRRTSANASRGASFPKKTDRIGGNFGQFLRYGTHSYPTSLLSWQR
jgi:hypothetical protein